MADREYDYLEAPDTHNNVDTPRIPFKRTPYDRKRDNPTRPRSRREDKPSNRGRRPYRPAFPKMETAPKPTAETLIRARRSVFEVYTSNLGINSLCELVHRTITNKDNQARQQMPNSDLLSYVTHICYIYRLAKLSDLAGYGSVDDTSRLKKYAEAIRLPAIVASYIESIGLVTLSSSAIVAPKVYTTLEDMTGARPHNLRRNPHRHEFYYDYRVIGRRLIQDAPAAPEDEVEPVIDETVTAWDVIPSLITRWNMLPRIERSGPFRVIDYSVKEGKMEMLVSGAETPEGLRPSCPEKCSETTAFLGACYKWRDSRISQTEIANYLSNWPPSNGNYLLEGNTFTATTVEYETYMSGLIRQIVCEPQKF